MDQQRSLATEILAILLLIQQLNEQVVKAADGHNITGPILPGSASFTPRDDILLVSPNHQFALGFVQQSPAGYPLTFSLSLFYLQLTQQSKTIVWTANRGLVVSENATLQLTADGNLVLDDSGFTVWQTSTSGMGVASAAVNDNGNLVLTSRMNASGPPIWESWLHPTDTLLPGQSLFLGTQLIDKTGKYLAIMQGDFNFVLYSIGKSTHGWDPYWASDTTTNPNITEAYFDPSGNLNLISNNKTDIVTKNLLAIFPPGDFTGSHAQRIVLTDAGLLISFLWSNGDGGNKWTESNQIPSQSCVVAGLCGRYGICSTNNSQHDSAAICSCATHEFERIDSADWSLGCRSNYSFINCDLGTRMVTVIGVQFINVDLGQERPYYDKLTNSTDNACSEACSISCLCAAALYDSDTSNCYLSTFSQLKSGNMFRKSAVTYLKLSKYPTSTGVRSLTGSSSSSIIVQPVKHIISNNAAIGIGVALAFTSMVGIAHLLWWWYERVGKRRRAVGNIDAEIEVEDSFMCSGGPIHFLYKDLHIATNGFRDLLGRGGFGPVYKGVLAGGFLVAVKKLEASMFGEKQFKAEVKTIGSVHHMNLVRLRGFCAEGSHRLLVYDFMENGSLDRYIWYRKAASLVLDWDIRFQIILSTARAIKYLHEECDPPIVHCDIKPQNILLDRDFCAKVSDFGMARLVGSDATGSITTARGTPGYMAPEWLLSDRISNKADVYSFGMVLLEAISGRRMIGESDSVVELAGWAYGLFMDRQKPLQTILDPRLQWAEIDVQPCSSSISTSSSSSSKAKLVFMRELHRSILVAFWCIQKDPNKRPTMGCALQMLEGLLPVDPPPNPFGLDAPARSSDIAKFALSRQRLEHAVGQSLGRQH